MKTTPEQRAALKATAERFMDTDLGLALSNGCLDLIADLEEARVTLDGQKIELYEQQKYILDLEAELAATRQQLAHWKANHDNVVKKLRLFTQREDLPVDRLPAYQYMLELEKKLAEAQAGEARALADFDQLCESGPSLSANDFELIRMTLETRPSGSSALQSAIDEAIEQYKRNAERDC